MLEEDDGQETTIPADARISRDIVRIHARLCDRGPAEAKTIWDDEIVTCVLHDVFTKAERTLIDGDHFDLVRARRTASHDQVEPLLCRAVEMATGHYVEVFLGQVAKEGVTAMVFVLGEHAGSLYGDVMDGV
jgi:uncharacterized protein YbcI